MKPIFVPYMSTLKTPWMGGASQGQGGVITGFSYNCNCQSTGQLFQSTTTRHSLGHSLIFHSTVTHPVPAQMGSLDTSQHSQAAGWAS